MIQKGILKGILLFMALLAWTGVAHPLQLLPISENPVAPSKTVIMGRVMDRTTSKPIESYDLKVIRMSNQSKLIEEVFHDTHKDKNGRFKVILEEEGIFRIAIRTSQHATVFQKEVHIPIDGAQDWKIKLDRGISVSGTVVDCKNGMPVQGAIVGVSRNIFDRKTNNKIPSINCKRRPKSVTVGGRKV